MDLRDHEGHFPNSNIPTMHPLISRGVEASLILVLLGFRFWKRAFLYPSKKSVKHEKIMVTFAIISFIDMGLVSILSPRYKYPLVAAACRPIFFVLMFRGVRQCWMRVAYVMIDSLQMVILIVIHILFYAWLGNRYFNGTPEGVLYFDTFLNSAYNLLVLLTTANFPDIMLPAY